MNQTTSTSTSSRRLALVTGASSGIGRAFAERFGEGGYDLVVVARRGDRLEELVAALPQVKVRPVVADLGTDAGVRAVAEICAAEDLDLLVNNAGVAHYMPFAQLPADKADELLHVKVVAPTLLARAAVPRMVARGKGTIINVSGMLAFSGPAPVDKLPLKRAVYTATLAHTVALSQVLHEELREHGIRVQVLCPGVVATEFHERQGLDLSKVPRMSAEDVVTASLRGLELGEVVCAPGVENRQLLDAVFQADLAAFAGQSPTLATRYAGSRAARVQYSQLFAEEPPAGGPGWTRSRAHPTRRGGRRARLTWKVLMSVEGPLFPGPDAGLMWGRVVAQPHEGDRFGGGGGERGSRGRRRRLQRWRGTELGIVRGHHG